MTIDERIERITASLETLTADLTRMRVLMDDIMVSTAQLTHVADHDEKRLTRVDQIGITIDEATRVLILNTLAAMGNNKTKTAQVLGITTKTLQNKLKEYRVRL
jgi:DNA-binding NtrC family response regulator